MRDDRSLMDALLALSTDIERVVQEGKLNLLVPTAFGSDAPLGGLEADHEALNYVIERERE
jgi:hypothetical protein